MPMPSAKQLDDNLFFTHTTHILPANGLMTPGALGVPGTRHPELPIFPTRMTLHWFPQALIEPHLNWPENVAHQYFILEPAKYLKSTLYGGFVEDFMSLGSHRLSKEAVIFAPEDQIESAKLALYPGYNGTLLGYVNIGDMKKTLNHLIDVKTPGFKLTVPQNQQKQKLSFDLDTLLIKFSALDLSKLDETDRELRYVKESIKKACEQNPRPKTIELDADAEPNELYIIFNGKKINARQFFRAWETQGLYFGPHHGTSFQHLDTYTNRYAEMTLQSAIPVGDKTLTQIKACVRDIKKILKERKFPPQVLDYFEQKIEIDLLEHWIPTLGTIALERRDLDSKFQQLNEMVSQSTVLSKIQIKQKPIYEEKAIPKQVTATLLTEYTGTLFSAYKRQHGDLVDGVAVLQKPTNMAVQTSLKQAGILSYLTENELIVPDINTPMVGCAVRKSLHLP